MNNQDPKDPLLLDHDYDGIQELDNKLPRWWVWLFNLSIVFAVVYFVYYHAMGKGTRMMENEYAAEMDRGAVIKARALAEFENGMASRQPSTEPRVLAVGLDLYTRNCAPCHRPDGGGLVGPNLCDNYWIHGSNFVDNLRTIWNGVPAKGMVTWKGVLRPDDIYAAASYIYTFRGTNPKNPKPAENTVQEKKGPSDFE
jgi:cytochrome c oxidase cbb3-type subunit 3